MKYSAENLNKIFVTSDTHAFHVNIVEGTSTWDKNGEFKLRPFADADEMTKFMVDQFNSIIPEDGILFHLGDWSFAGKRNIEIFRSMLNVKTIHLVTGNHDEHICRGEFDYLFTSRQSELKLSVGGMFFHMFHHPIDSWDHLRRGAYHLHGHMHWQGDNRFGNGQKMDVGVDGNDYKPYALTEVIDLLSGRIYSNNKDHHA